MRVNPDIEQMIQEAKLVDLPDIATELGFDLQREGSTYRLRGHGGLILYKDGGLWKWKWFSQDKGGDAIAFVMEFQNLSFREAVEFLAGRAWPGGSSKNHRKDKTSQKLSTRRSSHKHSENPINVERWQNKALAFAEWAHERLFSSEGEQVRRWLAGVRGIDEETARRFKLGWCPREIRRSRADWGLPPEGRKCLWLPSGLVIPKFLPSGQIYGLTFRLFKPEEAGEIGIHQSARYNIRYYSVPSLFPRSVWIQGEFGKPLIIVESELDLILLSRFTEGADITLIALGTVDKKPDSQRDLDFFALVATSPGVLLILDNDEPGRRAAEWWLSQYRHVLYWPTKRLKDPGELWKEEGDKGVRNWLLHGLETLLGRIPPSLREISCPTIETYEGQEALHLEGALENRVEEPREQVVTYVEGSEVERVCLNCVWCAVAEEGTWCCRDSWLGERVNPSREACPHFKLYSQ